jgi:hypothetical protein
VRVVGYFLRSTFEECLERNAKRQGAARIPDVGVYSTAKVLVAPDWSEGFDELHEVTLAPPDGFRTRPIAKG